MWFSRTGIRKPQESKGGRPTSTTGAEIIWLSNGIKAVWKPATSGQRESLPFNFEPGLQSQREVAGYLVDKAMGHVAGIVPVVWRTFDGAFGALVAYVEAPTVLESANPEKAQESLKLTMNDNIGFFDEVVGNTDRNYGNLLIAKNGSAIPFDCGLILPFKGGAQRPGYYYLARDTELSSVQRNAIDRLLDQRDSLEGTLVELGITPQAISTVYDRITRIKADGRQHGDWMKG